MAHSKQEKEAVKEKELGISPFTYGLGVASKYMFLTVAGVAAAVTTFTMALTKPGKEGWRNRDKVIEMIEAPKKIIEGRLSGNSEKLKGVAPILAASAALGVLVSHFVQIPALARGRVAAKRAADKYDAVLSENARLKQEANTGRGIAAPDIETDTHSPQFAAGMKPPTSGHTAAQQQRRDVPPVEGVSM